MQFITILSFALTFLGLSTHQDKLFPEFQYQSVQGETINNQVFANKESVVILGHLGCYPLMLLIKDLQDTTFGSHIQPILILENTTEQIREFNSTSDNMWSRLRTQFGIDPLEVIVIGECMEEKIKYVDGDTIILSQCRNLSKKLRTKSSPTTYIVNEKGIIEKTVKGYIQGGDINSRLGYLLSVK